jgi:hypothetical protein
MTKTTHGTVRGRTIELAEDLGLSEGQSVEVRVTAVTRTEPWGEGLRRTAGALADDPDWDVIMEEIYRERKNDNRPEPELE